MKKILLLLSVMFIAPVYADDVTLISTKTSKVVKVDLEWQYEVITANLPKWQARKLSAIVSEQDAVAWINASFFCPNEKAYSRCGRDNSTSFVTVQEWIATMNQRDWDGIFGFDVNWIPSLRDSSINVWWLYYGISMKPILLKDWYKLNIPKQPAKQAWRNKKGFICYSADTRYVMFWFYDGVTYYDLQNKLLNLWCANAIALDAGWSTALNYKGKNIYSGRAIPNWFIVVKKWRTKWVAAVNTLVKKDWIIYNINNVQTNNVVKATNAQPTSNVQSYSAKPYWASINDLRQNLFNSIK